MTNTKKKKNEFLCSFELFDFPDDSGKSF